MTCKAVTIFCVRFGLKGNGTPKWWRIHGWGERHHTILRLWTNTEFLCNLLLLTFLWKRDVIALVNEWLCNVSKAVIWFVNKCSVAKHGTQCKAFHFVRFLSWHGLQLEIAQCIGTHALGARTTPCLGRMRSPPQKYFPQITRWCSTEWGCSH